MIEVVCLSVTMLPRSYEYSLILSFLGSCKPWNDLTTNNELSDYSIELSVQMGVSTGPP